MYRLNSRNGSVHVFHFRPHAGVSSKPIAKAEFACVRFSHQLLATLWRHLAFERYSREKTQKIAF
jgi:hypothetical protein